VAGKTALNGNFTIGWKIGRGGLKGVGKASDFSMVDSDLRDWRAARQAVSIKDQAQYYGRIGRTATVGIAGFLTRGRLTKTIPTFTRFVADPWANLMGQRERAMAGKKITFYDKGLGIREQSFGGYYWEKKYVNAFKTNNTAVPYPRIKYPPAFRGILQFAGPIVFYLHQSDGEPFGAVPFRDFFCLRR